MSLKLWRRYQAQTVQQLEQQLQALPVPDMTPTALPAGVVDAATLQAASAFREHQESQRQQRFAERAPLESALQAARIAQAQGDRLEERQRVRARRQSQRRAEQAMAEWASREVTP